MVLTSVVLCGVVVVLCSVVKLKCLCVGSSFIPTIKI